MDTWKEAAACRGMDVECWFPEHRGARSPDARRTCARCAVAADCLAYALAMNVPAGIWGGLNESQRRPLRRQIRAGTDPNILAADYLRSA